MKSGKINVKILIHSLLEYDKNQSEKYNNKSIKVPTDMAVRTSFSRKSAYSYGWDFAPRIINYGIQGVQLILINQLFILDVAHTYLQSNN